MPPTNPDASVGLRGLFVLFFEIGRSFGAGGEGYVRIALVPAIDDCVEAARRIVEFCR